MEELILKSIAQAIEAILVLSGVAIAFVLSYNYVESWGEND